MIRKVEFQTQKDDDKDLDAAIKSHVVEGHIITLQFLGEAELNFGLTDKWLLVWEG